LKADVIFKCWPKPKYVNWHNDQQFVKKFLRRDIKLNIIF
jgi:hypothetical protein